MSAQMQAMLNARQRADEAASHHEAPSARHSEPVANHGEGGAQAGNDHFNGANPFDKVGKNFQQKVDAGLRAISGASFTAAGEGLVNPALQAARSLAKAGGNPLLAAVTKIVTLGKVG